MALIPTSSSSCLDLTISMPGFPSSSPSLPSSAGEKGGVSGMRDLDINQVPTGDEEEEQEEWMMMMMMMTSSGTTGVIGNYMEDEEESSNVVGAGGGPPRKKLRLSKQQSLLLEESFRQNHTLNTKQKEALAMELKLRPRQVEVWFQNRRARSKLKQTEMECEYLKRWFGSLTEQNRRLQREVEELRAMKVGPPTVFSPHSCEPMPASTLTMCPGCERVTSTAINKKGPSRGCSTTPASMLSAKETVEFHS